MTSIEWTDTTDNIITVAGGGWWCRKISEGCQNCYAANINQNTFLGGNKLDYSGNAPKLELKREILQKWSRLKKPKKHFVSSMTDVFGEWAPADWHLEILDAMAAAPNQIFQLLTKRPQTMAITVDFWLEQRGRNVLPQNIWVGTSVENNKTLRRVNDLLCVPAYVRFLSCEPLLENIADNLDVSHIDWVIVGGESGRGVRPCDIKWIRNIVQKCQDHKKAVFVKQLGSVPGDSSKSGIFMPLDVPGKGGDMTYFPSDLSVRQFPR